MEIEKYREHLDNSPLFTFEQVKRDVELLAEEQPQIYSLKETKSSPIGYILAAVAGVVLGFALKSVVGINNNGANPGAGWPQL